MSDALMLQGLDLILRTQMCPADPALMDAHIAALTADSRSWREAIAPPASATRSTVDEAAIAWLAARNAFGARAVLWMPGMTLEPEVTALGKAECNLRDAVNALVGS